MKKKVWVLEVTKMGKKQYLQPGNFWSPYKEGALQFGTRQGALEMKSFNNYAAKAIQIEI